MLNINVGHNPALLKACRALADYAEYTARIRKYSQELPVEEAVERTITECIREGILEEFLRRNRSEAKRMSIYEYDQAKHIRQEREEAWEEGREEGRREGQEIVLKELISKKRHKGKTAPEIAEELEMEESEIRQLIKEL